MRFEFPTLKSTVHPSIWGGGSAGWSGKTASSCWGIKTIRLCSESQCDHTKSIGLCETTCGWQIHNRIVTCCAWWKRRGCARVRRYRLTWHKRKSADVSKWERTMSINSTGKCERLLLLLALKKEKCRKYKVRSELLHCWVTRKKRKKSIGVYIPLEKNGCTRILIVMIVDIHCVLQVVINRKRCKKQWEDIRKSRVKKKGCDPIRGIYIDVWCVGRLKILFKVGNSRGCV